MLNPEKSPAFESTGQREPAEVYHPATYIRDEIRERDWRFSEFVTAMQGDDPDEAIPLVCELLVCDLDGVTIGDEEAGRLARAFGTSPDLWLKLNAAWNRRAQPLTVAPAGPEDDEYEDWVPVLHDFMATYKQLDPLVDRKTVGIVRAFVSRHAALLRTPATGTTTLAVEDRYLCEIERIVPRVGDVWRFLLDQNCADCQRLHAESAAQQ